MRCRLSCGLHFVPVEKHSTTESPQIPHLATETFFSQWVLVVINHSTELIGVLQNSN